MVIPSLLTEFYEENEAQAMDKIRYLQTDIGEMQKLREENSDDWEIGELTRHIIFLEAQTIEGLKKEIENAREDLKKLG